MLIETQRLILREFKRTDWKEVHEYAADPEVVRFMEWGPNTADQTKQFIGRTLDHQREKPRLMYDFAVILKGQEKLIGACGLGVLPFDAQQASLGYCYNRSYWRRGFGSEACDGLLRFAFEQLKLHRVFATCDADNHASAGVMRKNGMRQEAHFVQDKLIKGRWRDTLLLAILRSEWEQRQHG